MLGSIGMRGHRRQGNRLLPSQVLSGADSLEAPGLSAGGSPQCSPTRGLGLLTWTSVTTQLNLATDQTADSSPSDRNRARVPAWLRSRRGWPRTGQCWGQSPWAVKGVRPVFGLLEAWTSGVKPVSWGVWSFCSDMKSPTLQMPQSFSPSLHQGRRA